MKKIILSLILSVFLISSVLALDTYKNYNIKVVQKNPSNWSTVENGMSGNVILSHGVINQKVQFRAKAILIGLEPFTGYTLIYYGNKTTNDVWPAATCITSGMTNKHGNVRLQEGLIDYSKFVNNWKNEKFWIIKSSDVNCTLGRMTAWNPSEYLFETETI